ncbi:hypothetical protein RFI_27720 [Reticulomyxa filosa]|uniref:Uncharacterized protein n=1 Tax=Reticulomyxa filosa TaxID=46433 RepID=X6M6N6_RETFI|nr:hypothetical protein RFI_27720 [Reticulomyxa filosa]|eukprot:ETO09658.1 hypothetical protein RFI_27720 [Reticulomyxa filosa]
MNPSIFAMEDICCGLILNKREIKFDLSNSIEKIDICQNFETYYLCNKLERPGLYKFPNQKDFDILLCLKQYRTDKPASVVDYSKATTSSNSRKMPNDYVNCLDQNEQKTEDEYDDKKHYERKQKSKKKFIFICSIYTQLRTKIQEHYNLIYVRYNKLISFGSPKKMIEGFASFLMPLWHIIYEAKMKNCLFQ